MSFFPIEFVKRKGDADFGLADSINFLGNTAVGTIACLGLGAISYCALTRLGFSSSAAKRAAAIPIAVASTGTLITLIHAGFFGVMLKSVRDSLNKNI